MREVLTQMGGQVVVLAEDGAKYLDRARVALFVVMVVIVAVLVMMIVLVAVRVAPRSGLTYSAPTINAH